MSHTPGPWWSIKVKGIGPTGRKTRYHIAGGEGEVKPQGTDYPLVGIIENHADARLILRAVNCHDRLVEAAKLLLDGASLRNCEVTTLKSLITEAEGRE